MPKINSSLAVLQGLQVMRLRRELMECQKEISALSIHMRTVRSNIRSLSKQLRDSETGTTTVDANYGEFLRRTQQILKTQSLTLLRSIHSAQS